ncbi:hypothetical protein ES708_32633 [subsurface metagenome]
MEIKDEKGQETQDKGKEKTYTEAEHKGVIKDLQKERQDRQQFGFELSQSQSRVATLEKENKDLKEKEETAKIKKSVIEGEDEDILTKKDGRDIEAKVMTSIEKAQKIVKQRDDKERLDANFKKSCTAARTKYADRKDIGLDFEPVYQAAIKRIGGKKYKELDIYTSDNPGEELYQEGLKDPEMKEKLELAKNEKILDAMGDRKVDKKGLTGETKHYGFHFYTVDEVAAMKPEEALKVKPDIDKSMEKW